MKRTLALAVASCTLLPISSVAQKSNAAKASKPELQLRIIIERETYMLNEPLLTRTEFTNMTDQTLCFPEPLQEYEDSSEGYITTYAQSPRGAEYPFREHYDVRWPSEENLLTKMQDLWIKLGPNQTYVSKLTPVLFKLSSAGEWELQATYQPPEAAFGSKESRIQMRRLGKKIGCVPPETDVTAPVVRIQVVAPQ